VHPGSAASYLAERRRDGRFARLVVLVPELRDAFCYRRVFLSRRSAALDLALVAGLFPRAARAAARAPWALLLLAEARRRAGWPAPHVALVVAAGDLVALAALVRGSVASRSLLI
jgi:hypothetical protein